MHIGQGSQVEYIVNPAREGRFSFLQARRTVRVSPWALGSFSRITAFVALTSRSPVCVFTMSAPKGFGRAVFSERAVNSKISLIRASSTKETPCLAVADKAMAQSITSGKTPIARPAFKFCMETIRPPPAKAPVICSPSQTLKRIRGHAQVFFLHPRLPCRPLHSGMPPRGHERWRPDKSSPPGGLVPPARAWRLLYCPGERLLQGRRARPIDP